MIASIELYDISVFLHVAAVVIGFGSTYALSVTFPVAMKLSPRHLPYVHALAGTIARFFATPALVVVLLTGLYQVSEADLSFGEPWISATFAILIVLGGITGGYFIPSDRKLGAMVTREIEAAPPGGEVALSDEYQRGAKMQGMMGALTGVLLLVAIFLMVVKPGA
jgi:uncharacterized membrane protein